MVVIQAFPKDGQEYEVKWYGAVRKNSNFLSNPLVEVAVQNTSTNDLYTILVGVTELDALRVGTCWRDGELTRTVTEICGQQLESKVFEFDFSAKRPDVIDMYERSPENKERPYIPSPRFKLPFVATNKDESQNLSEEGLYRYNTTTYRRAKLNRMKSIDGEEVLISAMETLTGLYTPSRKEIRRLVLTKSKDDILTSQLEDWGQEGDHYMVKPRTGLGSVPLVFLAYLAQNADVQSVVDNVQETLQIAELDEDRRPYPNRYPEILPYHPRGLKFTATGIWLDNKKTRFLVIRVTSVVAPEEIPVNVYKTLPQNQQNPVGVNGQQVVRQQIIKARETHVTASEDPGRLAGRTYILSEIESEVGQGVINTVYEVDNNENNEPVNFETTQVFQECVQASAGEVFGTKSRVAQLENEDAERVDQLGVLGDVWNGLNALKDILGSNVCDVSCVKEDGVTTDEFYKINALSVLCARLGLRPSDFSGWMKDHGGRKMLLIQITMSDGYKRYIVEINRNKGSDTFSGACFMVDRISSDFIGRLCEHMSAKKTVIDLKPLLGKEGKFKPFTHRIGSMEWVEKMGRVLAKVSG
ncbi:hypothetical protein [Thiomicrospira pelophila]|uniref:hypothetical protein n=1 Tax=Thiomicrospira pelophila TaxID=934 RepID=UPI0004A76E46|nr:hypothetical protein [Thiomicrospira pelophila]